MDYNVSDLIKKVKNGDDVAFEMLAEVYAPVVEKIAGSVLRTVERQSLSAGGEIGEDLRQEARFALYRAAMSYDPEGDGQSVTFGLYAKICVKNALISELRRMKAAKRRLDRMMKRELTDRESVCDNTTEVFDRIQVASLMKKSEDLLSGYEKRVLMCLAEGKNVTIIASELGKTNKSVSNALYRIKSKLRELPDEQ